MILKIRVSDSKTRGERNWVYYDHINRLSVTNKFDHKKTQTDACWIPQHIQTDEPMMLIALFKDDSEKSIMVLPGSTYLLNDEGKTIERL